MLQQNLKVFPLLVTEMQFPHENWKYQTPLSMQTHILL